MVGDIRRIDRTAWRNHNPVIKVEFFQLPVYGEELRNSKAARVAGDLTHVWQVEFQAVTISRTERKVGFAQIFFNLFWVRCCLDMLRGVDGREDEFLGSARANLALTAVIGFLAIMVAAVLAVWLSEQLAKPLWMGSCLAGE
jgi:hypothetical protein